MSIYKKFVEIRNAIKSSRRVQEDIKGETIFVLSQFVQKIFFNEDQIPKSFTITVNSELLGWKKVKDFFEEIVGLKIMTISIQKLHENCMDITYKITLI